MTDDLVFRPAVQCYHGDASGHPYNTDTGCPVPLVGQPQANAWSWGGVDMTPEKFTWGHDAGEAAVRAAVSVLIAGHESMVRGVRMGTVCGVHVHDEWVPIERHHVWPLGMGGPDVEANVVMVCANGHGQIHAYLDHLIRYGGVGRVPWDLTRRFGVKVRVLGQAGWTAAGSPTRA